MRKSIVVFVMLIMTAAMNGGCRSLSKLFADEVLTKSLTHKRQEIKDAVEFSIGLTYNSNLRSFSAAGVKDSIMRKKIESLGREVYVKYQKDNRPESLPDSTVVFTSFSDLGTIEIIFDFATNERDLSSLIPGDKKYYFKKVHERTYYRRGPQSGGSDYAWK